MYMYGLQKTKKLKKKMCVWFKLLFIRLIKLINPDEVNKTSLIIIKYFY